MRLRKHTKLLLFFVFCLLYSNTNNAQAVDKVFFIKPVSSKIQNAAFFSFSVGYVATENRDIALDISGGPNKSWSGSVVKVKKGRGLIDVSVTPKEGFVVGKNYRIVLSMRESGGGWQTAMAGGSVSNIEIVKNPVVKPMSASFSLDTETVYETKEAYNFNIEYNFPEAGAIQVSVWKGNKWLGTSKKFDLNKGKGTKEVQVSMPLQAAAKDYKFQLNYGTEEDFISKKTSVVEIGNVSFKKPEEKLTMKEINAKSIQISLNKQSKILTLPGKNSYKYIRIVNLQGSIITEVAQTNQVLVENLVQGPYFVITSDKDYYKFVKF